MYEKCFSEWPEKRFTKKINVWQTIKSKPHGHPIRFLRKVGAKALRQYSFRGKEYCYAEKKKGAVIREE